jgi:hypothetical protein
MTVIELFNKYIDCSIDVNLELVLKGDKGMIDLEEKGWFRRHLFRNCLIAGIIAGGLVGWVIGGGASEGMFMIIIGMFGGFFVGFLVAMFMGD